MSRRHRFLTSKDLHWQWFNPLVFGMASEISEGLGPADALKEVEEMRAAALKYVENSPGWSKEVGLFVNIFGHNNVNSLFIHILDLSELGPSFEAQMHKNCPLEAVVKLLQEEAAAETLAPRPVSAAPAGVPAAATRAALSRAELRGKFQGTGGATSLKEELVERVPVLRDAAAFREARRLLREDYGGCQSLKAELAFAGFIDESGRLSTGTKPFNLFARIAAGEMQQPGMEEEQAALGSYGQHFMVCKNRPENDAHWDSEETEWLGKASMAARHRFLTTKDLRWSFFNALTLGMADDPASTGADARALSEGIQLLEQLRSAALQYAAASKLGWSDQLGLFFHVFGHNSVNSLHLHMVDMKAVGPTFKLLDYKNCPLNAILKVLQEELAVASCIPRGADAERGSGAAAPVPPFRGVARQEVELLELNVAGEPLAIPVEHLRSWSAGPQVLERLEMMQRDHQGRIYVDLPASPVKMLFDALRLRGVHQRPVPERLPVRFIDEELLAVAEALRFPIRGPARPPAANSALLAAAVAGAALAAVALRRDGFR